MSTPAFTYDDTAFRTQFPAFSNMTLFPEATLSMYWTMGNSYIANSNYGRLCGNNRLLALNLMCAHLTQLSVIISSGQTPYILNNATIDKITVGLTPPPLPNQWQWWLNTTPYGQQLLALLQAHSAGGFYVGGLPERSAIRKVYGIF